MSVDAMDSVVSALQTTDGHPSSGESKAIDLCRDTWVRMKIGTYKGDLAEVVDVDNVRQRVTVKLIPRIDLQALANTLEGREVPEKKAFTPAPCLLNVDEARDLHLRVERKRDPMSGDYFENIHNMLFKDGFLYKNVSMESVSMQNIHPSFDELEKFRPPADNGDGNITLFANIKKGHFMKGDRVIIVKGDLKNLQGWVEKVEGDTVHIKPNASACLETLAVNKKELCKYFEPGNHVKVVSGATEGATGMVLTVQGDAVNIVSDTTKEVLRVFSNNVVESSEVTSGNTSNGDDELHDLVQLDNLNYGVSVCVESEACQGPSCGIALGSSGNGETVTAHSNEIQILIPRKNDKIMIMGGALRGATGKLIGVDGTDGIVMVDDTLDLEILDMDILARFGQP